MASVRHPQAPRVRLVTVIVMALLGIAGFILARGLYSAVAGEPPAEFAAAATMSQDGDRAPHSGTSAIESTEHAVFPEVLSVSDAIVQDGTWWILDRRGHRIHRVTPEGAFVETLGRQGEGPGEFRRALGIVARGDTVVALDDWMLHLFGADGRFVADRRVGPRTSCPAGRMQGGASSPSGLLLLAECFDPRRDDGGGWHVLLETMDGSWRSVAYRARYDGRRVERMAGLALVLESHPKGFVFGSAYDDCLSVFDLLGNALQPVCHDWIQRIPLPSSISDEAREQFAAQYARMGVQLDFPEHLPPFERLSVTDDGQIAYFKPVPATQGVQGEVLRLIVRGDDGEEAGLGVPDAPIIFMDGDLALAAWEEVDGTRISFYTTSRE